MFTKYVVKHGDSAVVVKFDLRVNKLIVGGYVRHIDLTKKLVSKLYFNMSNLKNCHSQRNKVKYVEKMELDKFIEVMDRVSEDFSVEKVRHVNRLL